MEHHLEFTEGKHSTGMRPAGSNHGEWDVYDETKVVGYLIWRCQTGKCKPAVMCYECVCYSGQEYNKFFGLGEYNPPEPWDDD